MQPQRSASWPTPGYRPARSIRPSSAPRFAIRATPAWFASRSSRSEWQALLAAARSTLAAARAFNAGARS